LENGKSRLASVARFRREQSISFQNENTNPDGRIQGGLAGRLFLQWNRESDRKNEYRKVLYANFQ
jgi:hypothetical protein